MRLEHLACHDDPMVVRYASGALKNMQVTLRDVAPPPISAEAQEAIRQRSLQATALYLELSPPSHLAICRQYRLALWYFARLDLFLLARLAILTGRIGLRRLAIYLTC